MIFEVVTDFYNAKWEFDRTTTRLFSEDTARAYAHDCVSCENVISAYVMDSHTGEVIISYEDGKVTWDNREHESTITKCSDGLLSKLRLTKTLTNFGKCIFKNCFTTLVR